MDLELTKAVGVSNYGAKQLEEAQALLGDIPIAANQIKYSMLDRKAEKDGLVSLAADMDVALGMFAVPRLKNHRITDKTSQWRTARWRAGS